MASRKVLEIISTKRMAFFNKDVATWLDFKNMSSSQVPKMYNKKSDQRARYLEDSNSSLFLVI